MRKVFILTDNKGWHYNQLVNSFNQKNVIVESCNLTDMSISVIKENVQILLNNKVITEKKGVKKNELSLIPQLEGFICQDPPVDIMIINNYIHARNAYKNNKKLNIEDTIASSKEKYVEIAVRLAKDNAFRDSISKKISKNTFKSQYIFS